MRNHIDIIRQLMEEETPDFGADRITMTVPLFLRCLEWAKENAEDDIALHKMVEKIVEMDRVLNTDDYLSIIPDGSEIE
jgi:hypothetical protein